MKAFFFLTLLLFSVYPASAQTYVTLPSDSVYTTVDPNGSGELTIYWRNTSSQAISLAYQEIIASYPPGWLVQLCDVNACFSMPHPQGSTWPFAPGDSSFIKISVIPSGIPGIGLFCYEVTDTVAGYSTNMCLGFNATLTSAIAPSMEKAVQIFPNPAEATLRLTAEGQDLKAGTVELCNAQGTTVKRWPVLHGNFQEWDVSSLAAGIYRLTYSTPAEKVSRNVMIAR